MALFSRRLPSLRRVPASPVPRSQRYYEGATTSHPRIYGRLFVSLPQPTHSSFVRARSRAPGRSEVPPGPGPLLVPAALSPACSRVDANGISQVFRQSFPCLCSAPGPRSNQRALATVGHVDVAPAGWTAKASAMSDFGANTQLRHTLPYASRGRCRTRARLASGWLASLGRVGVEPTGSRREVSARVHGHPPLLLS